MNPAIDTERVRAAVQAYHDGFTWFADAEGMMIGAGMPAEDANALLIEVAVLSLAGLPARRVAAEG